MKILGKNTEKRKTVELKNVKREKEREKIKYLYNYIVTRWKTRKKGSWDKLMREIEMRMQSKITGRKRERKKLDDNPGENKKRKFGLQLLAHIRHSE